MTAHSILGASSAYRWTACPGSVKASEGVPDESSPFAEEGTQAHELAEYCLRNGDDSKDLEKYPLDMRLAVQVYLDAVRKYTIPGTEWFIEQTVSLAPLNPPVDMFGTADCIVYDPTDHRLIVMDYKHGAGVWVPAEDNMQLKYYALGALLGFPDKRIDIVEGVIVQPRCDRGDDSPKVRSTIFEVADLVLWGEKLIDAANATQQDDAPFNTGAHCRFCKGSANCPELRRVTFEAAQTEFTPETVRQPPAPQSLTTEQLGTVLVQADVIEHWLKSVRGHVHSLLEKGEEVPGVKLVQKRALRKWKAKEHVIVEALCDHVGPNDLYDQKLRSPAQVEKILGKKVAKEIDLASLYEAVSSGTTIALETDTREAITSAAGIEFLS
jgi:hypothetical protein